LKPKINTVVKAQKERDPKPANLVTIVVLVLVLILGTGINSFEILQILQIISRITAKGKTQVQDLRIPGG